MKRFAIFAVLLCVGALLGGCSTQTEKDFVAADVQVIGLYIANAQPAVEAYCDALKKAGQAEKAEQLRIDTQALANEMQLNAAERIEKLSADSQTVKAATDALNAASAALDTYTTLTSEADDGDGTTETE